MAVSPFAADMAAVAGCRAALFSGPLLIPVALGALLVHDLFGSEDVKLNYDVFFPSPWAVNADVEVEHRRLFHVSQK